MKKETANNKWTIAGGKDGEEKKKVKEQDDMERW